MFKFSNEICKFCGKPILIHGVQKALVKGRPDREMLHCVDRGCPLYKATGSSSQAIWDTWKSDLRERGLIE